MKKTACGWHCHLDRYEPREGYPPGFTIEKCPACGGQFVKAERKPNQ